MRHPWFWLVISLAGCASASSAAPPPAGPPLTGPATAPGTTREDALEVCAPDGQRAYLARLRCPDGAAPAFERAGSVGSRTDYGPGEPVDFQADMDMHRPPQPGRADHHVVDLYQVTCSDGVHEVFLDMYHCAQPPPTAAPAGFTLGS